MTPIESVNAQLRKIFKMRAAISQRTPPMRDIRSSL
jgi:hypothetical protein